LVDMGRQNLVLVTGGAGLVGSRLVRALLSRGRKVRVLDTRYGELENEKENPDLELVGIGADDFHGGMLDEGTVEESVRNIDVIFHLAINWDGASWRHTLPLGDLFEANIRGTLNLLEAAKASATKHFVFASSVAVYGETERTLALKKGGGEAKVREETACWPELWNGDPGPAYGIMKLATEKICLMYFHEYGLPVTVLRLEYVFAGERELKDGANVHVDDVVQAFLLAELNKKTYGQVFNLAYPTPHISTRKLQKVLGWRPEATKRFLKARKNLPP
jgi:nucleoside-diphosphate-sugar epimerase